MDNEHDCETMWFVDNMHFIHLSLKETEMPKRQSLSSEIEKKSPIEF